MGLPSIRADASPVPAPDSLRGRVVLVTGATGGLGRASALACAAAGATVVLLGRKVRALEAVYDEIEALGAAQPAIYPLDLAGATPDDHADLAETLAARLGGLHGVVHAAVHFDGLHPLDHLKPADWQRAIQVNATAPFLLTQACLPLLRESADAAVVFVLDDPARMHKAYWGGYGVSKQALATFAAILHEETDTTPVRVHALLPGPMRTGLRRMAYFGEDTLQQPAPEAAAAAVAFLLGPDALPLRGRTLDLRADG